MFINKVAMDFWKEMLPVLDLHDEALWEGNWSTSDEFKERQTDRDRQGTLGGPTVSWELSEEIEKTRPEKLSTCDPFLSYWQLGFGFCILRRIIIPHADTHSLKQT